MSDVVQLPAFRGLNFARAAIALAQSQNVRDAFGLSCGKWGPVAPPSVFLKAAVEAGTTMSSTWAGPFVSGSLSDEFIQFARGKSALEQLAPAMKNVEFGTRVLVESDESIVCSWVGEGAGKPLTFGSFTTAELAPYKLQSTIVVTKEFLRMSTADVAVRGLLAAALAKAQDTVFLSADAAISGISPAGILNGIAATPMAGDSATDIATLIESFQGDLSTSYLILHPSVGAAIGLGNSLVNVGARGGELAGIPTITSQHVLSDSSGSAVVLLDASQILFAASPVEVTTATHASLQMLDNPTTNSSTATATSLVSLFQSDSAALRVERFVSWQVARPEAVAWMSVDYAS